MSYDTTTSPVAGDATKIDDYVRLRDAIRACADRTYPLGGDLDAYVFDETARALPKGIAIEIDGTYDSGLTTYLEVNVQSHPDVTGSVTVTVDLYNETDSAVVASSSVAVALSSAETRTHSKSSAITLATGVKRYTARIKTSDDAKGVSAVAWVSKRG